MKIEKPRGTRDFTPEEMEYRGFVERELTSIFRRHGYRRISTPSIEYANLFELKSGEDIKKHMYVFPDKGGRMLCLRPEETAPVCRMFSETLRMMPQPIKVYYFEPMYRYEEPQKGRYREFWQLGVELIGPKGPESDAEVVAVAYKGLKRLRLSFVLELSHIDVIRGFLEQQGLDEKTQAKILSCIDKGDYKGLEDIDLDRVLINLINMNGGVEVIDETRKLLKDCSKSLKALDELEEVASLLDLLNVEYCVKPAVVRGLEYYTGIVFEVRVKGLGAQNQVCGGGRYDNLIELFSGMKVPAVGFAYGFDRVVEAMQAQDINMPQDGIDVVVAPAGPENRRDCMKIASELRENYSVICELMDRKLGKTLEYASNIGARYVVIVGSRDLEEGKVTLRDMVSGEQLTVNLDELAEYIK